MTASRSSCVTRFRFAWLMLLLAALVVRGTAPAGWMPVASADGGIEIAFCNGMTPMVLGKDGKLHQKAPANGAAEHCAFAGLGVADTPPPPIGVTPPGTVAPVGQLPDRIALIPGRGLAAPPPPATGPPAFA